MAFRARKLFGTFEKRAAGLSFLPLSVCLVGVTVAVSLHVLSTFPPSFLHLTEVEMECWPGEEPQQPAKEMVKTKEELYTFIYFATHSLHIKIRKKKR